MSSVDDTPASLTVDSDITPYCPDWPIRFCEDYQTKGLWLDETFVDVLERLSIQCGKQIAIIDNEKQITYQQLQDQVLCCAQNLYQKGFRKGHRIVVQLPNCSALIIISFALFRLGALPVYALPAHRIREMTHFCRASLARALICVDQADGFDFEQLAKTVKSEVDTLETLIIVGETKTALKFQDLLEPNFEVSLPAPPHARELALLQLSGGTTGLSKLIPRRHADYLYSIRRSNEICQISSRSVYLTALPMAHNFPMSSPGFFGILYAGGCVVLTNDPRPSRCWPLIEKHQVSITALVPPLLLLWLERASKQKTSLASLEILQIGGAKLLPEVAQRALNTFSAKLQQVFGMAEGLVNYTRLDDPDDQIIHTQGRPMSSDDEIKIVNQDGQSLGAQEIGHLITRGPYTIRGYFNAPEVNAVLFDDEGFYQTHDLAMIDMNRNIVVSGRIKDQINRGGEKFALDEVEDVLLSHPQIFDAAVVGLPDPYLGERACAFIVPKVGENLDKENIALFLKKQLAAYKLPDQFEFVMRFPQSAIGKISRQELREQLKKQLINKSSE